MNQELENIINVALEAGEVTPRQREIIINKAKSLGVDETEAEIYLDSMINDRLEEAEKKRKQDNLSNTEWVAGQLKAGLKKAGELSSDIGIKRKGMLHRNMKKKLLLGVCAGIADYYGISANIVRAIFSVLAFFGILGIFAECPVFWCIIPVVIYLVLAFIIPKEDTSSELQ